MSNSVATKRQVTLGKKNGLAGGEKNIAVLMACHNRVKKTLECLSHFFSQSGVESVNVHVFLVDDGSPDRTGEIIKNTYPEVEVIYADGSLFWNRGMHRVFGEALNKAGFDFYLWLNDDTLLYRDALISMLDTYSELAQLGSKNNIIVASTRDPDTGEFTYGGYISAGAAYNPLRLKLRRPQENAVRCDTMCGNCVLIPNEVAKLVGNIDSAYLHRWGDVDYGLRARKAGCEVWIAPGYLGDCEGNPNADRWRNNALPIAKRLRELHSIKGLGKRDWFRFVRTHGGALWITIWVRPYLRLILDSFRWIQR